MGGFQSLNLWKIQCDINVSSCNRQVVLPGHCDELGLLSGFAFVKVSTALTAPGHVKR